MPDVLLLPIDAAMADAIADPAAFERMHAVSLGGHADFLQPVVAQTLAMTARLDSAAWGGFLGVDAATRAVIGGGGYNGRPDADGCIEIAYFTLPPYEGRGWAGAMAAALMARAATLGARRARAHTLPSPNASTRVLRRLGFQHLGSVVEDPEDGTVWRWERALDPAPTA